MLVKCLDFLRKKGDPWQGVKVFGQEINALTSAIARMNLYLNGVEDFSIVREDTLARPAFVDGSKLRKFDVVLANPPYSIKTWNREAFMNDKWGRNFLGTPPQGRADYAFFQHILASMDDKTGRCAILFPHGVLGRDEEKELRAKLVDADVIECVIGIGRNLFYNSPMEACIILCRNSKPDQHKNKILFIDAREKVTRKNAESYLEPEHIKEIVKIYNEYTSLQGIACVVDKETIKLNDNTLTIQMYVVASQNRVYSLEESLDTYYDASESMHNSYNELYKIFAK
jgi:type I restriction enzyme M protein